MTLLTIDGLEAVLIGLRSCFKAELGRTGQARSGLDHFFEWLSDDSDAAQAPVSRTVEVE